MSDRRPAVPGADLEAGGWTLRDGTTETLFRTPTATVEGHTLVYEDAALADALAEAGVGDGLAVAGVDRSDRSGGRNRGSGRSGDGADGGILAGRTDDAGPWRFFFATRLSFSPPLAPGIGTATVIPTVLSEARRSFAADLRGRGFRDVERGRSERMPVRSGNRARLTKYTASLDLVPASDAGDAGGAGGTPGDPDTRRTAPVTLSVEAFLAVWATGGSFRVAGGAHPVSGLDDLLSGLPADERPDTDPRAFRSELLDLIRDVE